MKREMIHKSERSKLAVTHFEDRKNELFYYSPYNFIRVISKDDQLRLIKDQIDSYCLNHDIVEHTINNKSIFFLVKFLPWDTNFFKLKTYKLFSVLYPSNITFKELCDAVKKFKLDLFDRLGAEYCFIEIPSEDIFLIQALNQASFRLSETRLTYFNDKIQNYNESVRYDVRIANYNDIENLRHIASMMRNNYDRFHTEVAFDTELADSFLAKYIEEAVKGFSDIVLVPNEENVPADSFLTANFYKKDWESLKYNVGKMVLSAVSSSTNKGWYLKLVSEMTYLFKAEGVQCAFMNTQSTNRAVFRVWEKLGYQLGSTVHILSYSKEHD